MSSIIATRKGSTKYAALSKQDQMFWTAALAAITNNPRLRGKAVLYLTTRPAPEINAVSVSVSFRRQGFTWLGTITVSLEQLDLSYEPGQMMLTAFTSLFGRAELEYSRWRPSERPPQAHPPTQQDALL